MSATGNVSGVSVSERGSVCTSQSSTTDSSLWHASSVRLAQYLQRSNEKPETRVLPHASATEVAHALGGTGKTYTYAPKPKKRVYRKSK